MKIKINNIQKEDFPEELIYPNFFINELENQIFTEKANRIDGYIGGFSQINFFVGANNSGKSRFLRGLMKLHHNQIEIYKDKPYSILFDEVYNHKLFTKTKLSDVNDYKSIKLIKDIVLLGLKDFKGGLILNFTKSENENLLATIENLKNIQKEASFSKPNVLSLQDLIAKIEELIKELKFFKKNQYNNKKYIPVLRSLFQLKSLHKEAYNEILKEVYFIPQYISIESGLDIWDKVYKL